MYKRQRRNPNTPVQSTKPQFLLIPYYPQKMQFKSASFVALAVWFAGAANASALNARVGPTAQAAIAHVAIHPILDPTLCVTPSGVSEGNQVVLSACANPPAASQIWGVNTLDNGHIVQFQNAGNNLCFEMQFDVFNGQIVTVSGCSNSDGSGRPVSNTEFDTSPQTITRATSRSCSPRSTTVFISRTLGSAWSAAGTASFSTLAPEGWVRPGC
ncbi:hypothetical protein B0H13DRAFT_2654940 [Mycena leptocephala]|nr:hypothetical protein B0H13DRAFT_2654940 [Mycena leptocephala]